MILAKAANIVRRDMLKTQAPFDGSFGKDCQDDSIPDSLKSLVRMILVGTSIKDQDEENESRQSATSTISQLMIFNCVKRSKGLGSCTRHSSFREAPLPIYLGLMVHAVT